MIKYLVGDATRPPEGPESKIIAHICNDIGAWGRGFVLSLTQCWPLAEKSYRSWYQMDSEYTSGQPELVPFRLGRMKLVRVSNEVFVANMIAQRGIHNAADGTPPIRYNALEDCLAELKLHALALRASVHMPRIGCGLAGGEWSKVEEIVNRMLPDIDVYVYDFDTKDARTIPWKK